jgi:hypothetical protein
MKRIFCEPHPGFPPYDACVEFPDPREAFQHIAYKGLTRDHAGQFTIPLSKMFRMKCDFVEYKPIATAWHVPDSQANPFVKDLSFSAQKEWRMVFFNQTSRRLPERILFHVPGLSKFVTKVRV